MRPRFGLLWSRAFGTGRSAGARAGGGRAPGGGALSVVDQLRRIRVSSSLGFLLALAALRILFLLAALDPEEERVLNVLDPAGARWTHGPERPLYDREELYAGTAAEAMRLGLAIPLSAYRFMPYGSGSLLVALAARPLYALFGPRYLAFKLLGLLITLAGGICFVALARRLAGERAARWMALLYLFAPPLLVRTALIAKGDHAEAMALNGLACLLATGAYLCARPRRRLVLAAAAGMAAGLGLFVTYSVAPVLGAVGLTALIRSRARPGRVWIAAAAGMLVGLIPWVATVASTAGGTLKIYGHPLGSTVPLSSVVERASRLVNEGLMAGYDLPGGQALRSFAGLLWLLAVALGMLTLVRRAGSLLSQTVLAGIAAQIAAYCLVAPDDSSRYLVPAYPLLLLAVLAPVLAGRRVSSFGPALVVLLGLLSQVSVIAGSRYPALRQSLGGTDWPLFGEIAGQKLGIGRIQALPPESARSSASDSERGCFECFPTPHGTPPPRRPGSRPERSGKGSGFPGWRAGRPRRRAPGFRLYRRKSAPDWRAALRNTARGSLRPCSRTQARGRRRDSCRASSPRIRLPCASPWPARPPSWPRRVFFPDRSIRCRQVSPARMRCAGRAGRCTEEAPRRALRLSGPPRAAPGPRRRDRLRGKPRPSSGRGSGRPMNGTWKHARRAGFSVAMGETRGRGRRRWPPTSKRARVRWVPIGRGFSTGPRGGRPDGRWPARRSGAFHPGRRPRAGVGHGGDASRPRMIRTSSGACARPQVREQEPGRTRTADLTTIQLLVLFFGLPLSILGAGLRRALGGRGVLLLLLCGTVAGAYDLALEAVLHRLGHGLPLPVLHGEGIVRGFGLFAIGAGLVGGLGGALVRFRGRGLNP